MKVDDLHTPAGRDGAPRARFSPTCGLALLIALPMLWVIGVRDALVYTVVVSSGVMANGIMYAAAPRRTLAGAPAFLLAAAAFLAFLTILAALYLPGLRAD